MRKQKLAPFLGLAIVAGISACSHPAPVTAGLDTKSIQTSVSPCGDFYQYACGNYNANNPIPADQSSWGSFSDLAERNRAELHTLLDTASTKPSPDDAVQRQVGDYYAACMDQSKVDQLGAAPLKPELDAIAAITPDTLAAELARLHLAGVDAVFAFGSDSDFKDATSMIAEVDQGGLGLPDRDYYTKTDADSVKLRHEYQDHVARMFTLLGDPAAQAATEAATVMTIETALAKNSMTNVARRDPNAVYHRVSQAQFKAMVPNFNWDAYFMGVGTPMFPNINVASVPFFQGLGGLLRTVSLADWKTYLRWHATHEAAPRLSQPFVDANFDFFAKTLTGQKELAVRWKRCVTATDDGLGEALGQLYVKAAFGPNSKQQMLAMVHDLEASLNADIQSVPWMSAETKKAALVKLAAISNKIGYPDKFRDYSSIKVTRDDYLGDVDRANAFEMHRQLTKIGKPVDRGEWGMTPPTVNAYYNPLWNEIVFPAGILQTPFFNAARDLAVNYGGIGSVIGHELTHGFDDQGSQFDPQGNLKNWWTKADADAFRKREDCLADQYERYSPLPGVHLNGRLTLGENTADNGGVRIAYAAMLTALNGNQAKVDGYTPPQRFFLGFAQAFCENVRPERARELAAVDPHSPGQFRVNGVVSNMSEFAQAFSCKPDDAMTAKPTSCRVW